MSMPYVENDIEEQVTKASDFPIEGNDVKFDFEKGDIVLTGGEPDGVWDINAIQQWIDKILITRINVYEIYQVNPEYDDGIVKVQAVDDEPEVREFGSRIFDIFFSERNRNLKMADIQREIEEALEQHPNIISVTDFDFEQEKRTLIVHFRVNTTYGDLDKEVIFDESNQ